MPRKFYIAASLLATSLILLLACATPESTIDAKSNDMDAADQRKSRVDSAQQVLVSDTLKKSLFSVQDTTKTKTTSRKQLK